MELSVVTVASLGLAGLCLTLIVRGAHKEAAVFISIVTSLLLLGFALRHIQSVFQIIASYIQSVSGGSFYFSILIKVMLTAYVADFTAQLCKDAGEASIASKVELAGKAVIFVIASPVVLSVMELISRFIEL